MSDNTTHCKYNYDGEKVCPHPIFENGYCIFHLPKLEKQIVKVLSKTDIEQNNIQIEKIFKIKLFELIEENETNNSIWEHDFEGFNFPSINLNKQELKSRSKINSINKLFFCKNAKFKGYTDFSNMIFREVDFNNTEFESVNFCGVEFREAVFIDARFNNDVFFLNTKFFGKTHFHRALFKQKPDFSSSHFKDAAFFDESIFQKQAFFKFTKFDKAYFRSTVFNVGVDFNFAEFGEDANFSDAIIKYAIFNKAKFDKKAIFICKKNKNLFHGPCFFTDIELSSKAKLIFEKVNLDKASFLDTNILFSEFRDVRWYKPGKVYPRREKALWDEFRPLYEQETVRDFSKISDIYRQLVKNYEEKRDFDTAEQFHIGEMEIRRKLKGSGTKSKFKKTLKQWLNLYNIYRLLSNYGTNYWQAFIVLMFGVFVLFPALFLIPYLKPEPLTQDSPKIISNYWDSLSFTLSSLPISRGYSIQYKGLGAQIMSAVTIIVLSSQFAILLLAIRRRFKR